MCPVTFFPASFLLNQNMLTLYTYLLKKKRKRIAYLSHIPALYTRVYYPVQKKNCLPFFSLLSLSNFPWFFKKKNDYVQELHRSFSDTRKRMGIQIKSSLYACILTKLISIHTQGTQFLTKSILQRLKKTHFYIIVI